jgi:transposase
MAKKKIEPKKNLRRSFDKEFKLQAVQMMRDGYSASSVSENLGIGNTNLLYRWKADLVAEGGAVAESIDKEVTELRSKLRRTERERDILKKALGILSQQEQ